MESPAESDSKPKATQYYYAIRKCDSLQAPAIFMALDDCNLYLDQRENDVTVEAKRFLTMKDAVEYVEGTEETGESSIRKRQAAALLAEPADASNKRLKAAPKSAALEAAGTNVPPTTALVPNQSPFVPDHSPLNALHVAGNVPSATTTLTTRWEHETAAEARKLTKAERKFEEKFAQLSHYKKEHGTCDVPPGGGIVGPDSKLFHRLDRWVQQTRRKLKLFERSSNASPLSQNQVTRLLELGFVADKENTRAATISPRQEKRFDDTVKLLAEYKAEYGTCDIPINHPTAKDNKYAILPRWTVETRKQIRLFEKAPNNSTLSQAQVKQLMDMDFCMRPARALMEKRVAALDTSWDQMFRQLQAFKEKHGHVVVPDLPKTELRHWIVRIREEYARMKKGKETVLTMDKVSQLSSLGFNLSTQRRQTFQERAHEWLEFKTKHQREARRDHEFEERIAAWAARTRRNYRLLKGGGKTNLTQEQADLLIKWGFNFETDTKFIRSKGKSEPKSWEERFQELLAYKEKHGDCLVPQAYPGLGAWVKAQRKGFQAFRSNGYKRVTPEKLERLAKVGFVFEVRKTSGTKRRTNAAKAASLTATAAAAADGGHGINHRDDGEEEEEKTEDRYGSPQRETEHRSGSPQRYAGGGAMTMANMRSRFSLW